jgi:KTSC domain
MQAKKPKPLKLSPIKSSWLTGAHYDAESKVLTVEMQSGKYEYVDVPKNVYDDFAATFQTKDSSGSFLNSHLRKYSAKKL